MPSHDHSNVFDPDAVVAAVLRGDVDQFRLIVREYGLLVRGVLSARLHHREDVDDLAHEVFLIAYQKLKSYESGNFRGWLLGIARFQLNNHWRKLSRRANAMERFRHEVAAAIEPEMEAADEDLEPRHIERLLDCITKLPERARQIVRAGLEGTRPESLAEELGVKPNAIYQARFRAHAALRKCMETQSPVTPSV